MKGRKTHHARLHPQSGKSGEAIERQAIGHAESGKAAEGDAMHRGGRRVRRRRGGAVPGRKAPRRIDKQARAETLKPGGPPSYEGPTKPTMPFSGAEAKDVPVTEGNEEPEYKARGGKLTAAKRHALPSSDFALPGHGKGPGGKGAGSYPIPDESHARNALARVSQHGSPAEKARVRAKVHSKYPGIGAK